MPKLNTIIRSLIGEYKKFIIKRGFLKTPYGLNKDEKRARRIIVSLTSYGRRVTKLAPIVIHSMMTQTLKPDKIILWLDDINWNRCNIPSNLKHLEACGLDIRFCKDIKSYKKLIPAIQAYPNDIIVTIDDDVYYEPTIIEELYNAYKKDPNSIHAFLTSTLKFEVMNNPNEYCCGEGHPNRFDFATGVGAILYSKKLLHNDVTDEDKFLRLAPNADDIWFYFMEYLNNTHVNMVRNSNNKMSFYPLDSFYQYLHTNSSLNSSNLHQNQNNIQIRSVMQHYNIKIDDLKRFSKSNKNIRYE